MTHDILLIEKREELKRKLAAGEYKTMVDLFLEWVDQLIRRITRQTTPLPVWYNTTILIPVTLLLGLTSVYVANDVTSARKFFELGSISNGFTFLYFAGITILPIISTAVIKQYMDRILAFWRESLLDATESISSLDEFESWLRVLCNRWLNFLVVVVGGTLGGIYLINEFPISGFSGYGLTGFTIIINLYNWNIVYLLVMIILLSASLRRYDLKLFVSDPASSRIINRLSGLLSFVVYFVAVFAAILTLVISLAGLLPFFGGSLLLFFWIPLILLFILNQTSLSSIIRKAKWKTLNEIQAEVEQLQEPKNLKDRETMEAIQRLMDYHDRVKATRNSAIDSRTVVNFINSLLLPLLAFVLGNLDKVSLLFSGKP